MKQHAPAADRNREPILSVLREVLPVRGRVLEIASGTGQHAAAFAGAFPDLSWQPTDPSDAALASIAAWRDEAGAENLCSPLALDVEQPWPVTAADAVVCINMIHIAPWTAARALLAGAGRILAEGGPLYLYGPYRVRDRPTAPSNEAFDASLRARDPRWGLRWLHEVAAEARRAGLVLERTVDMPANNLSVVLRRTGDSFRP
jgi:SAM-dependent methyltransferase